MLSRMIAAGLLISTCAAASDEPTTPAVEPAIIQGAEEKYSSEVAKAEALVAKAEAELAKAKKLAGEARLKTYKDRLTEITKSGDFDKAIALKARIEQLEKDAEAPAKTPKSGVKIIAAAYGVNQSWHDVTEKVQEALASKKPVIVSDAVFGDPAPDYAPANTLIVRYERKGKVGMTAIYAGRELSLP